MSVKWHQEKFDEAMKKYMAVTSRTLTQAINTKAYYIARKAVWFTHKASAQQIRTQLGEFITTTRTTKSGRTVRTRRMTLTQGTQHDAPLAALIINARLGRKGKPGLYGRDMKQAVRDLISARNRSIAFLKSGWLPAIKTLKRLVDKGNEPPIDETAKQIGSAKGEAEPAKEEAFFKPVARIFNYAVARRDPGGKALNLWGSAGLQQAFDDEVKSINQYLEQKMKPDADAFNRSQQVDYSI